MPTTRRSDVRAHAMQERPAALPAHARQRPGAAPAFRVSAPPQARLSGSPAGTLVRWQRPRHPARHAPAPPAFVPPLRQQLMRGAPRPAPLAERIQSFWRRVLAALHRRAAMAPAGEANASVAPRPVFLSHRPAARPAPPLTLEGARLLQLVALPSPRVGAAETLGVQLTLGAPCLRVDEDGDALDVCGIDSAQLLGQAPTGASLLDQLCALPGGEQVPWAELDYLGVRSAALTHASCPISLHDVDEMRLPVAVRCEQVWRLFDLPALCCYVEGERAAGHRPDNPLNRRSFELLRDVRYVVRLDF